MSTAEETSHPTPRLSLMPCVTSGDADDLMRRLLDDKGFKLTDGHDADTGKQVTARRRLGDVNVFFTYQLIDAGQTAELVLVFEDPTPDARPRHETHFTFCTKDGWCIEVNDDQGYRRTRPDFASRPVMSHVEALHYLRRAMDIAAPANLPA